jgi:hypothetical protein
MAAIKRTEAIETCDGTLHWRAGETIRSADAGGLGAVITMKITERTQSKMAKTF